jgi:hypothetical protein
LSYLPRGGLEPPDLAALDPEPSVFTNFTTWAGVSYHIIDINNTINNSTKPASA